MGNCFLYKRGFGGGFGGGGGGGEDIPVVEKTASGKVILLTDSAEKPLIGLRLFGKTTQNGTPSPDAPVPLESVGDGGSVGVTVCGKNLLKVDFTTATKNGVTFTPTGDGGVRVTGTTQNYPFQPIGKIFLRAGVWYRASLNGTVLPKMFLRIINRNVDPVSIAVNSENAFNPKVTGWHDFEITINPGFDGETTLYPMIELGDTATAYEPYKDGSVTISTPNGLPGIHVSEGGNYTDENGWQWICDEVDFGRGVYVQRIGKSTLDKTNKWYWNTLRSCIRAEVPGGVTDTTIQGFRFVSSNKYTGTSWGRLGNEDAECHCAMYYSLSAIAFYDKDCTSTADFLAKLGDNSIEVQYVLATSIETDLTPEELAAYAALHTNYPSTTLYNDADSYMEVKYIAKGG